MSSRVRKRKGNSESKGLEVIGEEFGAFDKITAKGRTFTFWDQFAFWFGATSLPAAWYYGALMAGWRGLAGALILIFVVNTLSLIPWAYLGYIAERTGASSMAMVRPAFGLRGSVIPSLFYLVMGLGWGVVNAFLGAIALSFIFNLWLGWPAFLSAGYEHYMIGYLIVVGLFQGAFAAAGHRVIKILQWVATVLFLVLGAYQTFIVLKEWGSIDLFAWHPVKMLTASIGPFTYSLTFPLLVDLLIAYNWTWEFIGDFSRFSKNKTAGTWGPFLGANLAQYWWFMVGALGVVFLAVTTGAYTPLTADPSSTTVKLGFGFIAALVILFATITTNAANIYASALGLSNILGKRNIKIRTLLFLVAAVVIPLSMTPLASQEFVGFYIFFLDFLGSVVVPLWTLTLVDFFLVKKGVYSDDLFKHKGGAYWYQRGFHVPAIITLLSGTVLYMVIAYGFPSLREQITAAIPTAIFVTGLYIALKKRFFSD